MDELDYPQVEKSKIHGFLEAVTGIQISDKVMVDMILDSSGKNTVTILGRPQVEGSARSQMRHVTPYAIMESFIKSKLASGMPYAELITQLSEPIKTFVLYQPGICVNQPEYVELKKDLMKKYPKLTEDFYHVKINSTGGGPYQYLIDDINIISKLTKKYVGDYEKNYIKNMFKFLDYSMESLKGAIKDKNTVSIACEAVGRLMLTMFNQRPHAAFPKEGNTLNYEIRLYKSKKDAEDASMEFKVITHDEAANFAGRKGKLKVKTGAKVRIVHNEGNIVKKSIDSLKRIEKIVFLVNDEDDEGAKTEIEDYNASDTEIKIRVSEEIVARCNTEVDFDDISSYRNATREQNEEDNESTEEPQEAIDYIKYHIAKHLYAIFDFKPLEKKVLVANKEANLEDVILVYPSATGDWKAKYEIQNGKDYREKAINDAIGYNKKSIFREETIDLQLLASKVVDHVYLSLLPFESLQLGFKGNDNYVDDNYALEVLKTFSAVVVNDYEIHRNEKETFAEHVEVKKKTIEMFKSNDDSMLFDSPEIFELVYNIELSGNN